MLVLIVIGLGISTYSFAHNQAFVSGAICTLNDTFNCDVVNRGPYSQLFGVPVALIGIIGYGLMALGTILHLRAPHDRSLTAFLLVSALGGLGFSFYLTGIEAFVLQTWCLLCLTSQAAILGIFGSAVWLWILGGKREPFIHPTN